MGRRKVAEAWRAGVWEGDPGKGSFKTWQGPGKRYRRGGRGGQWGKSLELSMQGKEAAAPRRGHRGHEPCQAGETEHP